MHSAGRRCCTVPPSVVAADWRVALALAIILPVFAGCNRGPQFALVEGVVTLDGRPLADVEVVFMPDPERGNLGPHSTAYTDAQGRYRLHCDKPEADGVILGAQRVCIRDITALPAPYGSAGPQAAAPTPPRPNKPKMSRVPEEYTQPARTPFRDIDIKPGRQELNFDVTARGRA